MSTQGKHHAPQVATMLSELTLAIGVITITAAVALGWHARPAYDDGVYLDVSSLGHIDVIAMIAVGLSWVISWMLGRGLSLAWDLALATALYGVAEIAVWWTSLASGTGVTSGRIAAVAVFGSLFLLYDVRSRFHVRPRRLVLAALAVCLTSVAIGIKGAFYPHYLCILFIDDIPKWQMLWGYSGLRGGLGLLLVWAICTLLYPFVMRSWKATTPSSAGESDAPVGACGIPPEDASAPPSS